MKFEDLREQLTAYALGELGETDAADVEAILESDPEARAYVDEIRGIGAIAEEAYANESLGDARLGTIFAAADAEEAAASEAPTQFSFVLSRLAAVAAVVAILAALVGLNAPVSKEKQPEQLASIDRKGNDKDGMVKPGPNQQVSEAEQRFRHGIDLYDQGVYREALNEFSRALALDPGMDKARDMIKKSESRIALSIGEESEPSHSFEIFDTESMQQQGESGSTDRSAQELKATRVEQLMQEGDVSLRLSDHGRAMDLYEEVLLIDPANREATRKLAEATLGEYNNTISAAGRDLTQPGEFVRRGIESGQLPDGYDSKGVAPPASEVGEQLQALGYVSGDATPQPPRQLESNGQSLTDTIAERFGAIGEPGEVPEQITLGIREPQAAAGAVSADDVEVSQSHLERDGADFYALSESQRGRDGGDQFGIDVNGDGVTESIPFYTRPDGANVINNTVTQGSTRAHWGVSDNPTDANAPDGVERPTIAGRESALTQRLESLVPPDDLQTRLAGADRNSLDFVEQRTRLAVGADFTNEVQQFIEQDSYDIWPEPANEPGLLGVELQIADATTLRFDTPRLVPEPQPNTETYDRIVDNPFKRVIDEPLSTFSIDVDTGAYANVRRFLRNGQLPPKDAVRIEELINYFDYAYTPPANDDPFAAHVELFECPWNTGHQLMRIGLKGREVEVHTRPPANLVFLLDVSGSMKPDNKLPLVRKAMKLLTKQLRPDDRVAIVTYAGSSGLALASTPGTEQRTILDAVDRLNAGGSTNGASGIELAYEVATENFRDEGVNRVILATDGDFNVGVTDRGSLERLIETKAESGVFLTVLGVGDGNLKDATVEQLANKGNGHYAYLDSQREARKVLVDQLNGTLVTIAKDVKIQIDFNPAQVGAYRLIGYENRKLAARDFDDDTKDAGEIGAGHAVTALYEIVKPGEAVDTPSGTRSRYQAATPAVETQSDELLTVKLRHKKPDGDTSELLEIPVTAESKPLRAASRDARFATAVAAFGMALRESSYRGTTDWDLIANLAEDGLGDDPHGYRAEFMEMIQVARQLKPGIALPLPSAEPQAFNLELLEIRPWTGGKYVAEIRSGNMSPKRYGVGDKFGGYELVSIDPSAGEIVVYSEAHRRKITLKKGEAEARFRSGIDLYENGVYREALNEFSRALALDPDMEKARDMIKKSESRIALGSIDDARKTPDVVR